MASERLGQRAGTFEAQLVGQELTAKRNEIAQALQSMQGILTEDQRITLRQQLGLLDQIHQAAGLWTSVSAALSAERSVPPGAGAEGVDCGERGLLQTVRTLGTAASASSSARRRLRWPVITFRHRPLTSAIEAAKVVPG